MRPIGRVVVGRFNVARDEDRYRVLNFPVVAEPHLAQFSLVALVRPVHEPAVRDRNSVSGWRRTARGTGGWSWRLGCW